MSKDNTNINLDPVRLWREWCQKSEKSWNDAISQLLGDDRVAKSTGKYLQEALHTQRMFSEAMAKWLANLNLPSRSDMLALSDRVGKVEDALAGLQVEIRQLRQALTGQAPKTGGELRLVRPKRTKTPPQKE
ncbi:MAG: hypothetical protein AB7P69_25510 [Candidatus Binatia bacterium]